MRYVTLSLSLIAALAVPALLTPDAYAKTDDAGLKGYAEEMDLSIDQAKARTINQDDAMMLNRRLQKELPDSLLLSVVDFIRIEEVKGIDPSKDFIQTTDISGGHRLDGYSGTHFAVQPYIGLQMKRRMASRSSPSVG
ncbi:hypothetical protein [Stenotrophomonas sp. SrG]|uniref:hypothetical protein n=1 Tax=Stenotrophomonas sp. SrG TaxID=3414430 RepID=UPI003CE75298